MNQDDQIVVFLRDQTLRPRGTLSVVGASATLKKNKVGKWAITVDGKHPLSKLVAKGWGVIVYSGDTFYFSGPIDNIKRHVKDNSEDLVIGGVTDTHVLSDHVVFPDPASIPSAQGTDYWTQKGTAEALMVDLVNNQCGPSALASRRSTGLVAAVSAGRGPTTSIKARLTNVLTEVQALALVGNLVFDVVQVPDTQTRELVIREMRDQSRSVRFTPQTGLGNFEANEAAPKATAVIVGGQGEGAARTLYEAVATPDGWDRRIEVFQDRRDTDDADELSKASAETLETNKATRGVSFTVIEGPLYKFGLHYQLGDIVTIEVPGVEDGITDVVNSVEIDWTPHDKQVTVIVGEDNTPARDKRDQLILEKLRRLEAR